MELRKDPITKSWVVIGRTERQKPRAGDCPLCPDNRIEIHPLLELPRSAPWQVRVFPHFRPLYHVEGDANRSAEGIYDRMELIGAHEIVVETRDHAASFADLSDEQIQTALEAYASRIVDLKRDGRMKYVTISKNQGPLSGEEWTHAYSQVNATTFVPRRILYELRSAREWYRQRERCVFCDILRQEIRQAKRMVDSIGDYHAFCPYAARIPYETWIMSKTHNHQFEHPQPGENRRHLATLIGRVLRRILSVTDSFHMVLHTAPNTVQTKGELSEYWRTIEGDYHWHIEILPILPQHSKSYSLKEVYFNGTTPETAAEELRQFDPGK
jgi:UDPglucose--hexose-1-phosphate uridylyltransferase